MLKVFTLAIDPETEDMYSALSEAARLVNKGYTSGYDPDWSITEEN